MRALLATAGLALVVAAPAFAETPEEAVAYAFLGLADGATLERSGTTIEWTETAASPATFDGVAIIGGHRSNIRFIITATEDCRYEITLQGPANLVPGGSRLFGRVSLREIRDVRISETGYKSQIEGTGFCQTGQHNPSCMVARDPDLFGTVDLDRHRKMVAFLQDEVCVATTQ
ncbi:hypothetical protein [Bauldia sp.]|uniref:hypothetical protein n=1 Tax=Bauldia sp. TaxID=2575872 RepID=UPI003BA8EE53